MPGADGQAAPPKSIVQINYVERGLGFNQQLFWDSRGGFRNDVFKDDSAPDYDLLYLGSGAYRPGAWVSYHLQTTLFEGSYNYVGRFHVGASRGTGTFAAATQLVTVTGTPYASAIGDVNGDDFDDVLVATNGDVHVYTNNGAGGLTLLGTVAGTGQIDDVMLSDINQDGTVDLVTADGTSNSIKVYLNNGAGVFTLNNTLGATGISNGAPQYLDIIEQEQGGLDIFVADAGAGQITEFNDGTDGFISFNTNPYTTAGNNMGSLRALRMVDFYGNGTLGYATIDATGNRLLIGARADGYVLQEVAYALTGTPVDMQVVDFNGDGHSDVLVLLSDGSVKPFLGNGNNVLTPQTAVSSGIVNATVLQLSDVDHDGDDDLLVAGNGSATMARLTNSGGSFTAQSITLGASPNIVALEAVDFNNDGALDIVYTDAAGNVRLLTNGVAAGLENLIVRVPQQVSGNYNNVTVMDGGIAVLDGALNAAGNYAVQSGGALRTECETVTGAGSFTLASGATIVICDPAGITSSGATGAIRNSGARTFSTGAVYSYTGVGSVVTGAGLPATVAELHTTANTLSLTNPVTITRVVRLGDGANLNLGNNNLTLRSDASGTAMAVQEVGEFVTNGTGRVIAQRHITPAKRLCRLRLPPLQLADPERPGKRLRRGRSVHGAGRPRLQRATAALYLSGGQLPQRLRLRSGPHYGRLPQLRRGLVLARQPQHQSAERHGLHREYSGRRQGRSGRHAGAVV